VSAALQTSTSPVLSIGRYEGDDRIVASTRSTARPALSIGRHDAVTLVLGRGSDPRVELHVERCLADGVPVVRRSGGGCSVLLDPGNIVVGVCLPVKGLGRIRSHFDALTRWLIRALERAGVPGVVRTGVSDLVLGDRKIGGSCIARSRGLLLFSSTILVAPRVELMERYLAHPPREPGYRRGRGHGDFVGSIGGDAGRLASRLERTLSLSDL
jgi:lipoate-protein ligase A